MLRKRKYDYIYAGLHFHSLLWGLAEIRAGRSVLIVDSQFDQSYRTSAYWGLLNYFEHLALKQKWQVTLGDLGKENLFEDIQEELFFGNEVLRLGYLSPKANLLELKRRFRSHYPKVQPDLKHFDEVVYKLAKDIYAKLLTQPDYVPSKKERAEQPLLNFLCDFASNIEQNVDLISDCLSPMRFYYLFETQLTENSFLLLLLSLLPRYQFSENEMEQKLKHYFLLAGGEIKKTKIDQVLMAKNRDLLQVRLQSLEGMLLTHKLHFFGGTPEEGISIGSLHNKPHQWSEVCLSIPMTEIDGQFSKKAMVFLVDQNIFSEEFGPIWLRQKGHRLFFYSYYRFRFGFNDKDIKNSFYSYLKTLFYFKFNSELPELSRFGFNPIGDQLCFSKDTTSAFLPSGFRNSPQDHHSKEIFYSGLAAGGTLGLMNLFWAAKSDFKPQTKSSRGQTAVEYLLLLLVISIIAFALMKKLNEKLLGDAGDCTQGGDSLICQIQALMNAEGNFKYFRINQ